MAHVLTGIIKASCPPVDYTKHNGERGRKAVLLVEDEDGHEWAITVTKDLLNWVGCEGMKVRVEYMHRVAQNTNHQKPWLCNDIYAVRISRN